MTAAPIVTLENVSHRFGKRLALDDLSLSLDGGLYALLGPNGAGKTTLMRLLATIYRPQSGKIIMFSNDLSTTNGQDQARQSVGYLPQSFGFYPHFTVEQFVRYFALLCGVQPGSARTAVKVALGRVGLMDRSSAKMRSLSGGMVRRVGIAQAIVHEPRLLILDEPSAGLDPDQRYQLRSMLQELSTDRTVLLSTHLSEDFASLGGNVLVLNDGQLRYSGTRDDLVQLGSQLAVDEHDPRTPVERGYSVALTISPGQA